MLVQLKLPLQGGVFRTYKKKNKEDCFLRYQTRQNKHDTQSEREQCWKFTPMVEFHKIPLLPCKSSLGSPTENVTTVLNESERDQLPQQCSVATDENDTHKAAAFLRDHEDLYDSFTYLMNNTI